MKILNLFRLTQKYLTALFVSLLVWSCGNPTLAQPLYQDDEFHNIARRLIGDHELRRVPGGGRFGQDIYENPFREGIGYRFDPPHDFDGPGERFPHMDVYGPGGRKDGNKWKAWIDPETGKINLYNPTTGDYLDPDTLQPCSKPDPIRKRSRRPRRDGFITNPFARTPRVDIDMPRFRRPGIGFGASASPVGVVGGMYGGMILDGIDQAREERGYKQLTPWSWATELAARSYREWMFEGDGDYNLSDWDDPYNNPWHEGYDNPRAWEDERRGKPEPIQVIYPDGSDACGN